MMSSPLLPPLFFLLLPQKDASKREEPLGVGDERESEIGWAVGGERWAVDWRVVCFLFCSCRSPHDERWILLRSLPNSQRGDTRPLKKKLAAVARIKFHSRRSPQNLDDG